MGVCGGLGDWTSRGSQLDAMAEPLGHADRKIKAKWVLSGQTEGGGIGLRSEFFYVAWTPHSKGWVGHGSRGDLGYSHGETRSWVKGRGGAGPLGWGGGGSGGMPSCIGPPPVFADRMHGFKNSSLGTGHRACLGAALLSRAEVGA